PFARRIAGGDFPAGHSKKAETRPPPFIPASPSAPPLIFFGRSSPSNLAFRSDSIQTADKIHMAEPPDKTIGSRLHARLFGLLNIIERIEGTRLGRRKICVKDDLCVIE